MFGGTRRSGASPIRNFSDNSQESRSRSRPRAEHDATDRRGVEREDRHGLGGVIHERMACGARRRHGSPAQDLQHAALNARAGGALVERAAPQSMA